MNIFIQKRENHISAIPKTVRTFQVKKGGLHQRFYTNLRIKTTRGTYLVSWHVTYLVRSSPLRPFPRVLLCPLSIPKVTIVYGVGCSLNLNISYYCSSVSWEYRRRLVEYGQAIDPQNLPLSGHPLLQKARTFGLGPPRPPLNKHNKFQHTVPSHIKSCTAHWGWEGGPRQKARLFVTEGIWQRKPRFNKQGLYAWLWSGHLSILCMMPVSNYLREPGRDMWYQCQSIWWTQNLVLHPGTLVRPTS